MPSPTSPDARSAARSAPGPDDDSLLLPSGTRLLHIGAPKTGTTALQQAAAAARESLLAHGVRYPGGEVNHLRAAFAFMRRKNPLEPGASQRAGTSFGAAGEVPPRALWDALVAEIDADTSCRALISHENISSASPKIAKEFIEALGADRTHVVITLAPLASVLPSLWSQNVKGARAETLDDYLRSLYPDAEASLAGVAATVPLNQAALVERWATAAGAENVTVIVTDRARPHLLTAAIEAMLGLPEGLLAGTGLPGTKRNRSLTLPEADVIRRFNEAAFRRESTSWWLYRAVIARGAMNGLIDHRVPPAAEPRPRLPRWAAERVAADGARHGERIAATGVRVVGDLANLSAPPPLAEDGPPLADTRDRDIAVEALVGAFGGAEVRERELLAEIERLEQPGKDRANGDPPGDGDPLAASLAVVRRELGALAPDDRARRLADALTTRDLVRAAMLRLRHRLRVGRSMRLR